MIMDTQAFWNVIGTYNQSTWIIQILLFVFIALSIVIARFGKCIWMPKFALGITNLFIGMVFFLFYGTELIQKFFAFPLYIAIGCLFLWEAIKHKTSDFEHFDKWKWMLFCLIMLYPFISMMFGNNYPEMVVYIMPCPVISLSIVIYSCYIHKNRMLLILMTIWGLTGIKAFIVSAYEDIILLACGIYCFGILVKQFKNEKITLVR